MSALLLKLSWESVCVYFAIKIKWLECIKGGRQADLGFLFLNNGLRVEKSQKINQWYLRIMFLMKASEVYNTVPNVEPAETGLKSFRKPVRFTLAADKGWGQRLTLAVQDVKDGMKLCQLIWALALSDIKLRYRGSAIGPFWLTISTGVQIGAMAFLYADLFHTDIHVYLPFLTVSLIIWGYLNSVVNDGCNCFIGAEGIIKGTRMPFVVHAARSVIRNLIVLGHNLIVMVVVFLIMGVSQSFHSLLAIPGFLLWLIDGLAISLALGAVCARFRDVPQIVAAIMQIAFFLTPIMWMGDTLRGHKMAVFVVQLNPFLYLLDIIRNPLLGQPLTLLEVGWALAVSAVIIFCSLFVFARTRGRIAFWV